MKGTAEIQESRNEAEARARSRRKHKAERNVDTSGSELSQRKKKRERKNSVTSMEKRLYVSCQRSLVAQREGQWHAGINKRITDNDDK